jgi:hypothetical protein
MTRGQEALAMSASDDDLDLPEASDPALLSRLRVVTPTPQELADHEDYLQSLQKTCRLGPVWTRPAAT